MMTDLNYPAEEGDNLVRVFESSPKRKREGKRTSYINFLGGGWVLSRRLL
jgi:hypothetical protein